MRALNRAPLNFTIVRRADPKHTLAKFIIYIQTNRIIIQPSLSLKKAKLPYLISLFNTPKVQSGVYE